MGTGFERKSKEFAKESGREESSLGFRRSDDLKGNHVYKMWRVG